MKQTTAYVAICDFATTSMNTFGSGTDSFKIFPNPVKDLLWVSAAHPPNGGVKLKITDLTGRVQYETTKVVDPSQALRLDLNHLNEGIYMIGFFAGDKLLQTVRPIKE